MSDTQLMHKTDFEDNEELTESQVVRLSEVPESVRNNRSEPARIEPEIKAEAPAAEVSDKVSVIGESLRFKGELTAGEDLVIEGTVEGTINQGKCCLTVKPKGRLIANVNATKIFIEGKVKGDLHATVSVKVRKGGEVEGNIVAPTVSLDEGATFNGSIEMRSPKEK